MATNTVFAIINSRTIESPHKIALVSEEQLRTSLRRDRTNHHFYHKNHPNIFIIIWESLTYSDFKNGFTPFLKELSDKGVLLDKFYANGKESIDAVPSILCSIPKMLNTPFISYVTKNNYPIGINSYLSPLGYSTYFFHGASDASMGFRYFSNAIGINRYYSMANYPYLNRDYDGAWGIYDGPFFSYSDLILSSEKKPFFTVFFTLSSHNPYNLPSNFHLKKGEIAEMSTSMRYTDESLKNFFREIREKNWYKNTLFIITGDHTHLFNIEEPEGYHIPFILFNSDSTEMTEIKEKINKDKIGQQTDIMPTIIDYLNLPINNTIPFGESLFSKGNGLTIHYHDGLYMLMKNKSITTYTINNSIKIQSKDKNIELKSYVQYYFNNLLPKYLKSGSSLIRKNKPQ